MRMLASFLCCFLLLLVFGTGSYVYLLWHHYWARVERLQWEQQRRIGQRFYHGEEIVGRQVHNSRNFYAHGVVPTGESGWIGLELNL